MTPVSIIRGLAQISNQEKVLHFDQNANLFEYRINVSLLPMR